MRSDRLERISIERPCPKRWSELVGDERRRFCSACALHVTNLSALTRPEAEQFLAASRGRVCVTYVPTETGAVALRRAPGRARRLLQPLARAASLLLGLLFLLPGCRPSERPADPAPVPPDDAQPGDGRLLGKVRADPVCQVDDDQRMILGEMVAPEPKPAPEPGPE